MKAPKYQRMDAFSAALQTAVHELDDPILGLELTKDGIVAWDGKRAILMSYGWHQSYGDSGEPHIGGGHWSAEYLRDCGQPAHGGENVPAPRAWWRLR